MIDEGDLIPVQSHEVERFWADVEPHLKRLEAKTQLASSELIRQECERAEKQLWAFDDGERICGVIVTQVYDTPRGRICCIWAACGTETFPGQIEYSCHVIERWARSIGCVVLEIKGRRGWERKLAGFKRTAVVLEKDLCSRI